MDDDCVNKDTSGLHAGKSTTVLTQPTHPTENWNFQNSPHLAPTYEEEGFYVFPASFAQRRMWFLEEYVSGSPVYHLDFALRIQGRLNPVILGNAFNKLLERHESLRTFFALTEDDSLAQLILPSLRFPLPVESLEGFSLKDVAALCQQLLKEPFPLTNPPLLRPRLFQLGEEDHVFFLSMHHILADGWSLGLLLQELREFYESELQDREPVLAELEIQYADFAEWEQETLQGESLASLQAYWKESLTPLPPSLELPHASGNKAVDFAGAHHYERLSANDVQGFRQFLPSLS